MCGVGQREKEEGSIVVLAYLNNRKIGFRFADFFLSDRSAFSSWIFLARVGPDSVGTAAPGCPSESAGDSDSGRFGPRARPYHSGAVGLQVRARIILSDQQTRTCRAVMRAGSRHGESRTACCRTAAKRESQYTPKSCEVFGD